MEGSRWKSPAACLSGRQISLYLGSHDHEVDADDILSSLA